MNSEKVVFENPIHVFAWYAFTGNSEEIQNGRPNVIMIGLVAVDGHSKIDFVWGTAANYKCAKAFRSDIRKLEPNPTTKRVTPENNVFQTQIVHDGDNVPRKRRSFVRQGVMRLITLAMPACVDQDQREVIR